MKNTRWPSSAFKDKKLIEVSPDIFVPSDQLTERKPTLQNGPVTKLKFGMDKDDDDTIMVKTEPRMIGNFFQLPNGEHVVIKYEFLIDPCAAPRMTQRDTIFLNPNHSDPKKRQRKSITKYFAFKRHLQALCLKNGYLLTSELNIIFLVPMPVSWSTRKRKSLIFQPHTCRPDRDNFLKAFQDTFKADDGFVWDGRTIKLWSNLGRIIIF